MARTSLPATSPRASWTATRRALLPMLGVLVAALLVLFEREWRHGEIFSPADLVFQFYPWAHDAPRTRGANATRSDEAFYHQPLMETHFARVRDGQLPDYDDTRLAGVPSFFQGIDLGRAFSPFSLPFYLLPAREAVNWYGPLRLLVAGLAMWLFLRDLGAGSLGAAAGGVAFALNGHFLTWLSAPMPTVAAWLPLVLRQVRRCVHQARATDVGGLALAVGVLCLGAYVATMLACLFGALVYGLAELWAAWRHHTQPRTADGTPATPGTPILAGVAKSFPANEVHAVPTPRRAFAALAAGAVLGVVVASAALVPMLAALSDSPARQRLVSAEGAVWPNLATLAMPAFWGSPVTGTWWHPDPSASYPEHVVYFGITVLMLAALGTTARLPRAMVVTRWTLVGLALLSFTRAYGVAPGRWLLLLPGQGQSNPFRWYALASCCLAGLAGLGVHAWLAEPDRRRRIVLTAAPVAMAGGLAVAAAAALWMLLPEIRARNLQPLERAQMLRFVAIAGTSGVVLLLAAWARDARVRAAGALVLVAIAAADLVEAHRGFNPTVTADRYYPVTPALDWLREHAADARIAPVDTGADLVQGHLWGLYGLSSLTGYDFHGDADYQAYLRIAQSPPGASPAPGPTVWDHVGLQRTSLDLRMLGVLGARFIVAAPLDLTPRGGGYVPLGPMTDGRTLTFTIPVTHDGVRRLDLLTATYARANTGVWHWTVTDDRGQTLAAGEVQQASLRDNDWWRLEWPPVEASTGRRLTLTLRSRGSGQDSSATLLVTGTPSPLATTLQVDGQQDARALWFRTFSTAPERFDDARLVYAGDLNIYRNPHGRPRAWFVRHVRMTPAAAHASEMHTTRFDVAREAWLDGTSSHAPTDTARVTSIALEDDQRTIGVEAPDGGVLVVGERAHAGWAVTIDGRPVPWQVANGVLIGVSVPPGSRTVALTFSQPYLRASLGLSLLVVSGITFAFLLTVRRPRT